MYFVRFQVYQIEEKGQLKIVRTKITNIVRLVMVLLVVVVCQISAIELSQSLQPASIPFEGTAQFEIKITWEGPQSKFFFPKPLRPQFERLSAGELSSSISSVGTGPDELTTKHYKYTLIPTLSGLGRIEPITIEYINRLDSVSGQLLTEPMTLSIDKPKPVVRSESGNGSGVWLTIIGLIVIIGGGGLYYLLVVKGKSNSISEVSPEQDFLANLDALQKESADDLKRFQTGLYKLLAQYLSQRYQVSSETDNATKLVEQLKSTSLQTEHREVISAWLIRAEKEKFTPAAVAPGATMRLYSEIKQFFETKLVK